MILVPLHSWVCRCECVGLVWLWSHWRSSSPLATLLYNVLWLVAVRWTPRVELGFDNTPSLEVRGVHPGSPAEKMGLRSGDRILSIGRTSMVKEPSLSNAYAPYKPGDSVQITVARPGSANPVALTGVFRRRVSSFQGSGLPEVLARQVRRASPIPFVVVGLIILFLRLEDPIAWLLALLFASYTSTTGFPDNFALWRRRCGPLSPPTRPSSTAFSRRFSIGSSLCFRAARLWIFAFPG